MPTNTSPSLPQWNLKDLLRNPEKDLDAISKTLNTKISFLEKLRPSFTEKTLSKTFTTGLRLMEDIAISSSRLGAYSHLWFAQNTTDQKARAFGAKVRERLANVSNRVLFFDLWWQQLSNRSAQKFLANTGSNRYYLASLRRMKPHALTEPEERIINIKNTTGRSALDSLYEILTNNLAFTSPEKGVRRPLSREQLSAFF